MRPGLNRATGRGRVLAMMNKKRFGGIAALVVAASALSVPVSAVAANAAAGSRSLSCTQTTVSRPTLRRAVSGTVDGTQVLLSATVTRATTGRVDVSTDQPVLDNTFEGGAFLTQDGLNTWRLGTQIGSPSVTYYLMLPAAPLPTGSSFSGLVFVDFGPLGGANDFRMACTAN